MGWKPTIATKTDADILREEHRFIRSDEEDAVASWEKRMARKYYDKLFKEYAIGTSVLLGSFVPVAMDSQCALNLRRGG